MAGAAISTGIPLVAGVGSGTIGIAGELSRQAIDGDVRPVEAVITGTAKGIGAATGGKLTNATIMRY